VDRAKDRGATFIHLDAKKLLDWSVESSTMS
jgi:hypothetical protein